MTYIRLIVRVQQRGDCILATEPSYSWVNHYARAEAYGSIGDFEGENYVL